MRINIQKSSFDVLIKAEQFTLEANKEEISASIEKETCLEHLL